MARSRGWRSRWGALLALCLVSCFRVGFPTAPPDAGDPSHDAHPAVLDAGGRDLPAVPDAAALDRGDTSARDTRFDLSQAPEVSPDGPPPCPAACNGGCPGGVCVITGGSTGSVACPGGVDCEVDCLEEAACPKSVTCGSGSCLVRCGGTGKSNQCSSAINCAAASSCKIECLGSGSCSAKITCGTGPCEVVCGVAGTQGQCSNVVDCSQSCACDVSCIGSGSCGGQVLCPGGCNVASGKGCSSTAPGCQGC